MFWERKRAKAINGVLLNPNHCMILGFFFTGTYFWLADQQNIIEEFVLNETFKGLLDMQKYIASSILRKQTHQKS